MIIKLLEEIQYFIYMSFDYLTASKMFVSLFKNGLYNYKK